MFARMKQVAAVGAAVAGLGWVSVVSPAVAHTQPPRIPPGNDISCPGGDAADLQYVPDPEDSNAYYICAGGVPQDHRRCPQVSKLILSSPPKCMPFPHPMP